MRIAVIDYDLCTPKSCDFLCQRLCPINRKGDECIKQVDRIEGTNKKVVPQIDEILCIGCGICINKCPFKAISIVNTPDALKEKPIHRYGKNAFALFRLPVPIKGVVGLLGANGCGKTTALKILSGQLKPSISNDWTEIIRIHRGTELHDYFEKLSQKKIKAVYKPQQVDALVKLGKGVVSDMINGEMIEKHDLHNCMNRKLDELSGGELQRFAIALASSKDADIYYFDEPTNHLDVKQRMNMAKQIRTLGDEKYVMLAEHDLASLDFLADRIHIFYGKPGTFGIVSKPYAVSNGINAFLDGYIAEDNVRIRESTIFEVTTAHKKAKKNILLSFSHIDKKYDKGFELRIVSGEVYEKEVLGVFGSNGLGKTTFAKMLAGDLEFDGEVSRKLKISYKPQYIDNTFDGTVRELLATVKTEKKDFIMRQLGVDNYLDKKLKNLSGGELQRVAIALCLSQDCDLYLLDEPTAYLDVDQRLAVARAIRNAGTAMVIDHDLLFLSYVSDRAMLFQGVSGIRGEAECLPLRDGFNKFLKEMGITFRRDKETKRPRANKLDSVKDREQKEKGEYFF
jgi:ATP-binding cassette subfamily E protein 1